MESLSARVDISVNNFMVGVFFFSWLIVNFDTNICLLKTKTKQLNQAILKTNFKKLEVLFIQSAKNNRVS